MSAVSQDRLEEEFQERRDGALRRIYVAANRTARVFDERRKAGLADLIVLSHAKSGRTWLRVMLSHLYETRYGLRQGQMLEFNNLHRQNPAIPRVLFSHGYFLRDRMEAYRDKPILFLVRNPIDVAVSQYFQFTKRTKQRNKDLINNPAGMEQVPMFDFILHPRNKVGLYPIVDFLNDWNRRLQGRTNVRRVRYEDMHGAPAETLRGVLDFIGADVTDQQVAATVAFADAENLRKLERQNFFHSDRLAPRDPDDPDSYKVRRAKVGGYRDYFDEGQIAELERVVAERLDPTFGYGAARDEAV
jgi:hypothetical protein